ncbi:MAG: ABC transporter ATP-binding protein [Planctomycetota bacterium]|nr:ABC transporter ATP-binding protein [Planctomycetota bacterium]
MAGLRHLLPRLLRRPGLFFGGMLFAILSAAGLGAGLLSLGPLLRIILEGGGVEDDGGTRNVEQLIRGFNDGQELFKVPEFLVDLLPSEPFPAVAAIVGGLAVLTLLGAAANVLHQYLALELAARTIADIRNEVFRHVMSMPLGPMQRRGAAELVSRINKDSMALQGGMLALCNKSIAQLTKGIAAFAAAIFFDWRLTIVALVIAPVLGGVLRALGRRIRRATKASLRAQEDLLRVSNESIQGVRAVKTSSAEAEADRRFGEANRSVLREELRIRTARALASPMVEMLAAFVLMGLVLIAVREILAGTMKFDSLMLTLGALGVAGGMLRPLIGLYNEIQAASAPAERLEELLEEPDEQAATAGLPELPRHAEGVRFQGVRYRYPGAERPALDGVELEIRHGEQVAVVGPNGCGKTTLLSLLPRLFDPDEGAVLVDGRDVSEVRLDSLRGQIGVVTQETVLFRDSIRANIAFGREATDERIRDAAVRAHAASFIDRLPQGYDTPVAELGTSLSGGQRQRLAIARALLRDPSVLILDEATSQIDAESEEQINRAIEQFSAGRTVLVIAHRLSTVLAADRIVVMDEGRVVDSGPHAELLERCETYRRIARTQLAPA